MTSSWFLCSFRMLWSSGWGVAAVLQTWVSRGCTAAPTKVLWTPPTTKASVQSQQNAVWSPSHWFTVRRRLVAMETQGSLISCCPLWDGNFQIDTQKQDSFICNRTSSQPERRSLKPSEHRLWGAERIQKAEQQTTTTTTTTTRSADGASRVE